MGSELEFFSETTSPRQKREKEGLISVMGSVYRYFFGVMDATDRENIEANMDQLYKKQDRINHFLNKSVSFLESQLDDYGKFKSFSNQTLQQTQTFIKLCNFSLKVFLFNPITATKAWIFNAAFNSEGLNRDVNLLIVDCIF